MDEARARALLAERKARREAAAKRQAAVEAAATLRSFFYPKQAGFFRPSASKLKTTTKTRRAGVTTGGCHELVARALTLDGHRAEQGFRSLIIHSTRLEARARAWRTDTKNGLVDIVARYGKYVPRQSVDTYELGGQRIEVRETEQALDFENGSRIELMGCDSESDMGKVRGVAKHVYWIDEAQDPRFLHLLEPLYKGPIVGAVADFQAEVWVTGTPGKDLAGMFYEITREDDKRRPGWDVHTLSVVDNPYFGATVEERWAATALRALKENEWAEDDPDFQREWLGKWVKSDANFVYAVNAKATHELVYAPPRLQLDGFPDVRAAMLDLPGAKEDPPRDYFLALGADLGTKDDFAMVLWAWSHEDAVLYEVCSWKKPGLDYDEMAAHLRAIREQVVVGMVVADAGGGGKPAVMGWSKKWVERYTLPIAEAVKKPGYKVVAIKQMNNDIKRGHLKFREGGALLTEMTIHRWSPKRSASGSMVEDPSTPNHCCDAGLYAHRESYHHRYREQDLPPPPGSAEWTQREERALEDAAASIDDDAFVW